MRHINPTSIHNSHSPMQIRSDAHSFFPGTQHRNQQMLQQENMAMNINNAAYQLTNNNYSPRRMVGNSIPAGQPYQNVQGNDNSILYETIGQFLGKSDLFKNDPDKMVRGLCTNEVFSMYLNEVSHHERVSITLDEQAGRLSAMVDNFLKEIINIGDHIKQNLINRLKACNQEHHFYFENFKKSVLDYCHSAQQIL